MTRIIEEKQTLFFSLLTPHPWGQIPNASCFAISTQGTPSRISHEFSLAWPLTHGFKPRMCLVLAFCRYGTGSCIPQESISNDLYMAWNWTGSATIQRNETLEAHLCYFGRCLLFNSTSYDGITTFVQHSSTAQRSRECTRCGIQI